MPGQIELDPGGTELRIRFDYDPFLVSEVKALPRRRWDPGQKAWRVPASDIDAVLACLMKYGFEVAPEVTSLLAGTRGTSDAPPEPATKAKPAKPAAPARPAGTGAEPADALTISAVNERVRQALRGAFPDSIWVVGEIADFDKNKGKEHVFFLLVEKRDGQDRVTAQVAVALFRDTLQRLTRKLKDASEPLALRDGIAIRARAKIDLYPAQGRFQLVIEEIDASYTLGQLALGREQLLRELRLEGLHERNRLLPMPQAPLRIAVVTSPDSDAWNDFQKELEGSGIGFQVGLYPVKLQGDALRPTVLKALAHFAARAERYDLLCILRGGGSRTDLAWFDDREVAFAVAKHPLKVLCGIGHERDQSVLDMIAHSEKTPTAVAGYIVRRVEEAVLLLDQRTQKLLALVQEAVRDARQAHYGRARRLRDGVRERLGRELHGLAEAGRRLQSTALASVRRRLDRTGHAQARLGAFANARIERERLRLVTQEARQRLLDPRTVLRRGFVLVRAESGAILTRAAAVSRGAALRLCFRDGTVEARAEGAHIEGDT